MKVYVALLFAVAGCAGGAKETASGPVPGAIADPGETVFTVNGVPVGAKELDLVFRRMRIPEDQRKDFAWTKSGKHVAEEYALANVLYQKALAEGLQNDPEVAMQIAFATRQILGSAMHEKLGHDTIDDAAIEKFYLDNAAQFAKPQVHVKQLTVSSASMAQSMIDRLKQGESFEVLAKAHSADPTAQKGGDLGWVKENQISEYATEAFAAPDGAILGPIEGHNGFYVVQVVGKRDKTPMEEVKPIAESQLVARQAAKAMEDIRGTLKIEWVKPPEGDAPAEAGQAAPGAASAAPGGEAPAAPGGEAPAHGGEAPAAPAPTAAGG